VRARDVFMDARWRTLINTSSIPSYMIQTGVKGEMKRAVEEKHTVAFMKSGMLDVLATPIMIAMIEATAADSVAPFLEPGTSTVGTMLDVKHIAPTPVGLEVVCRTELVEVDRRRLVFKVEVSDPEEVVGTGIHERFVVDNSKFMAKAGSKIKH
jgi:fluoroacetyl-CoA thioesterase